MELSYQLQTLEPLTGALDIIRFFGKVEGLTADADEIQESLGLSDRSFDKAIRRLVTKGYVQMDGNRVYRLTEQGQRAVEELAAYDQEAPSAEQSKPAATDGITRHVVMALPRTLVAGQPATVAVGIDSAPGEAVGSKPADVVLRLSVNNGEPAAHQDKSIELADDAVVHTFSITPGAFTQMRIRLEVFQLDPYSGDIAMAGGMYVDADVAGGGAPGEITAYGTDVTITPVE